MSIDLVKAPEAGARVWRKNRTWLLAELLSQVSARRGDELEKRGEIHASASGSPT